MTAISAAVLVVLTTLVLTGAAGAQDGSPRRDDVVIELGGRLWAASGYSVRKIAAGGIDRLSDLRFRGVDALVSEVSADVTWNRLVGLASVGGGIINDGVLIDEDFAANGARIARTRSPVDDSHLFYASVDIGGRVLDWMVPGATRRGYLDLLVGYQYWQEHYVAFGATGFPVSVPSGLKAILNEYEWHSVRIGARARVPIHGGFSLSVRGYVVPWTFLVIEDVHYLRSDLRQDPSFRDEADGGIGWQADGALHYAITPHLTIEAGFQYWKLNSADGVDIAFTTGGAFRQRLTEASTERYGPFIGVRWRF